ncbi:hypothetical protein MPTK1_2g24085 [Marchantia polymorpha subsp. ruderalis]
MNVDSFCDPISSTFLFLLEEHRELLFRQPKETKKRNAASNGGRNRWALPTLCAILLAPRPRTEVGSPFFAVLQKISSETMALALSRVVSHCCRPLPLMTSYGVTVSTADPRAFDSSLITRITDFALSVDKPATHFPVHNEKVTQTI